MKKTLPATVGSGASALHEASMDPCRAVTSELRGGHGHEEPKGATGGRVGTLRRLVVALPLALIAGDCLLTAPLDADYPAVEQSAAPAVVPSAPPPTVDERALVQPAGTLWVPGYWWWGADGYQWIPGHHVALPPGPGLVWVPPRYEIRDGVRYYWAGRWVEHR
jgi:hypothetical protein